MTPADIDALAARLTPHGHLLLAPDDDAPALPPALQQRLTDAFELGSGHGLLQLGAAEVGCVLPPAWAWWRDFATRYVTALCATPEGAIVAVPQMQVLDALVAAAPPIIGAEYLTPDVLTTLWADMHSAVGVEMAAAKQPLQAFLKSRHPVWNVVGRVHFNLAENRKDPDAPFAFLATYTARLSVALGEPGRQHHGRGRRATTTPASLVSRRTGFSAD